jgi:anti-sigma B factor antagonist
MDPDGLPNGQFLTVDVEQDGDALAIRPSGELDLSTTQILDAELRWAIEGDAAKLILDLSELRFIDSAGLRLLVFAVAHSRTNGDRLRMLRGSGAVARALQVSGLDHSLPFID